MVAVFPGCKGRRWGLHPPSGPAWRPSSPSGPPSGRGSTGSSTIPAATTEPSCTSTSSWGGSGFRPSPSWPPSAKASACAAPSRIAPARPTSSRRIKPGTAKNAKGRERGAASSDLRAFFRAPGRRFVCFVCFAVNCLHLPLRKRLGSGKVSGLICRPPAATSPLASAPRVRGQAASRTKPLPPSPPRPHGSSMLPGASGRSSHGWRRRTPGPSRMPPSAPSSRKS